MLIVVNVETWDKVSQFTNLEREEFLDREWAITGTVFYNMNLLV